MENLRNEELAQKHQVILESPLHCIVGYSILADMPLLTRHKQNTAHMCLIGLLLLGCCERSNDV